MPTFCHQALANQNTAVSLQVSERLSPSNEHHHCPAVARGEPCFCRAAQHRGFTARTARAPAAPGRHTSWGTAGLLSYKWGEA